MKNRDWNGVIQARMQRNLGKPLPCRMRSQYPSSAHSSLASYTAPITYLPDSTKMPNFSYSAILRTENPSLVIEATHCLVHGLPSTTTHTMFGSVPTNVDVLLDSDLVITISGTLNRVRLSSLEMSKSAVALHLKRYLETVNVTILGRRPTDQRMQNSSLLGLNAVSSLYIDENDNVTQCESIYTAFIHNNESQICATK